MASTAYTNNLTVMMARQLAQTQAALSVMGKAHELLELLSMRTDESQSGTTGIRS